jgi:hypothetical protein
MSASASRPGEKATTSLAWNEPGWLAHATAWIDSRVERTGPLERLRTRPWAATARVPTRDEPLWFKESAPSLAFEPALTVVVARRRPDCTPPVVATDGARMLTRECGTQLREAYAAGAPAPDWGAILPLQAEVQIDLTVDVEEALAAGAPDSRPHRLPELPLELGGAADLAPAIQRAVDGLGDLVPATVVHEELHDGSVFVRDGRPFFLDWAEACVSHPFVGTLLSLRDATERAGGAERLRDLYLEPFTRFAPLSELREAFWHGYVLGALCRAQTWHRILSPLPREEQWERDDRVAAWLVILRGLVSGTLRLGEA